MALSDHASITITQDTQGIARGDFGVPLFLSYNASAFGGDRIRFYSSLAEVAEDFSSTTGPEYLFAQAVFSQDEHVDTVAIGRGALPPTQKYLITVASVRNSHDYEIDVKGDGVTSETCSYTSDSGATQQEIANGLLTDLNAVVGKNYLATFVPLVVADVNFTTTHETETVTLGSGDLQTGDGPFQVSNSGGALPAGYSALTDYWWIRTGSGTGQLATSLANALAGTAVSISDNGTGTHTLADTASTVSPHAGVVVTGSAAGEWFSLAVNAADLAISQTHVDPGVATDLAAILLESNEWYCLITGYNSNAYVIAASDWVQANKKIYLAEVNETAAITTSAGNSDTLDDLATAEYSRVAPMYHQEPAEFFSAALAGSRLSYDAGSETWKFANLTGVNPSTLTTTQRTNLVNRNANFYQNVGGTNISQNGTMADAGFIDTVRFLDWLEDDMAASVFDALVGVPKVPYTDLGVAIIEGAMRGSLLRGVQRGGLSSDPEPEVTAPKVADIDSADRANRLLPDMKFSATLAGAIHKVTISGTVSV